MIQKREDNRGITHTVTVYACSVCGLTITEDEWTESIHAPCESIRHTDVTVVCGDTVILEAHGKDEQNNHRYRSSTHMLGNTCAEGVHLLYSCSACGYGYRRTVYDHLLQEKTDTLSRYGTCGGQIESIQCRACSAFFDVTDRSACEWTYRETDADGILVYVCNTCNAVKRERLTIVSEKDEACGCLFDLYYALEKDDHTLLQYECTYEVAVHDYEYTFDMQGASCTDGVIPHATCRDCGHDPFVDAPLTAPILRHEPFLLYMQMSHEGVCAKHTGDTVEACACGLFCQILTDLDYNENTDLYACPDCNLTLELTFTESYVGCTRYETDLVVIRAGAEELYRYEKTVPYANHSYETTNLLTYADGTVAMDLLCSACGGSHTVELQSYAFQEGGTRQELTATPAENTTVTLFAWEVTEYLAPHTPSIVLYEVVNGQRTELARVQAADTRGVARLIYTLEAGKTYVYQFEIRDNPYGDTVLTVGVIEGAWEQTDAICSHEQHESVQRSPNFGVYLYGSDSCTEGVMVGYLDTTCGCLFDVATRFTHNIVYSQIDLPDLGMCGGSVRQNECAVCGRIMDCTVYDYDCSWKYVETVESPTGNIRVERCDACGTTKYSTSTTTDKDGNCEYAYLSVSIYYRDGEEFLRVAVPYYYTEHVYEAEYDMHGATCADGYTVIETCVDCGHRTTREARGHHAEQIDVELTEYGLCGGWGTSYRCRVCHTPTAKGSIYDTQCTWEPVSSEGGVTVYHCAACNTTKHVFAVEGEPDYNGQPTYTETRIYYRDGEEIYRFEYGWL